MANPLHESENYSMEKSIMKQFISLVAIVAVVAFFAMPAHAQTWSNTLYGQEGTANDGYGTINAAGQGPAGNSSDNYTNWKYQTGAGSWSGVYSWDGDAWLTEAESGDETIDVECDIELYWAETIENNKIYFHVGNTFSLTNPQRTAYVNGTYAANHPEYLGISFQNPPSNKVEADFDLGTGTIAGGMVGTVDNHGTDISSESFDIQFMLSLNGGAYVPPTSFGAGAHGTIPAALWWSPTATGMTLGTGTQSWFVRILPDAGQADGNYILDPVMVAAPEL